MEPEDELDLRRLLDVARRWWWFVAAIPFFGAGLAAFLTSLQTPIYEAKAILLVNQARSLSALTYQDILGSQQLTETYARLVESRENLLLALERLPTVGLDVEELEDRADASAVRNTQLIEVKAEDPDPVRAAMLANAIAEVFPEYIIKAQLAEGAGQDQPLNTVFLAERAVPPTEPAKPNRMLNTVLGGLLGFVVAAGIVGVREYLDDTVKDRRSLERLGLPFLGEVPLAVEPSRIPWRTRVHHPLFDEGGAFAEAFRKLFANLRFAAMPLDAKVILVTSVHPGDGKTLVTMNLGRAAGEASERGLLIDGDLRRPRLYEEAGVPNGRGLTTIFVTGERINPSLVYEAAEGVYVLPSGPRPPNPISLLENDRMQTILAGARERFDRVFVDSPPAEGVADAMLLAGLVDGIVLVVSYGKTRTSHLRDVARQLERSGRPVLGVVVNRVRGRGVGYGAYYYYRYYYEEQEAPRGGVREPEETELPAGAPERWRRRAADAGDHIGGGE